MEGNGIPIWLNLLPEYIDQNFEKVALYLKEAATNPDMQDAFYDKTIDLLDMRVSGLVDEINEKPLYEDEGLGEVAEDDAFVLRLLGVWLLARKSGGPELAMNVYSAFCACLARHCRSEAYNLTLCITAAISRSSIGDLPFGWSDIMSLTADKNLSTLAYKVAHSVNSYPFRNTEYEGFGTLKVRDGILSIAAANSYDTDRSVLIPCISAVDDTVRIAAPKNERLKQSKADKMADIDDFINGFVTIQKGVRPRPIPNLTGGTYVKACVTHISNGHVYLKTIDPKYQQVTGRMYLEMASLHLYTENDFCHLLQPGMVIPVKYTDTGTFSIKETFVKHLIDRVETNICIPARLMFMTNKFTWWTEDGYSVRTETSPYYTVGDYALIGIDSISTTNLGYVGGHIEERIDGEFLTNPEKAGYINTEIPFDDEECKKFGFKGFAVMDENKEEKEATKTLIPKLVIRSLYRSMILGQVSCKRVIDRYKTLTISRAMATLAGFAEDDQYLAFLSDYLEGLEVFANATDVQSYSKIKTPVMTPAISEIPSTVKRNTVIRLLQSYGTWNDMAFVGECCKSGDETISRIAMLIQAAGNLEGVINKNTGATIKQEIKHLLAISDLGNQMWEDNGIYIGTESSVLEFKTSFLEAPDNASVQNQSITIFKTLCGFMNSEYGGTLYLGVNDAGYVCGIDADLQKLPRIGNKIYSGSMDSYIRYIQDRARDYFTQGQILCWTMIPAYNGQALEIRVRPFEGDIVEFNGVPYIRNNAETQVMTEVVATELRQRRRLPDSTSFVKENVLRKAIREKKCATLEKYASSNSESVEDRFVEPFDISQDGQAVICFEPSSGKNKIFKISRMKSVRLEDRPWQNASRHEQLKQDIFNMTGSEPTTIALSMTMRAKNCLIEEYPLSKAYISEDKNNDRWLLNADVYQIEGIGRFVVGLAREIKILKGDSLKAYLKNYCETAVPMLFE